MPDPIAPFLDALHANGRLRVWSIVITVFGDAVEHRGGRLAMRELQRITERIGISEGAQRTAMSRLAKEGWLMREKDGRHSIYRLSDARRVETAEAAEVIYRVMPVGSAQEWALILEDGPDVAGALRLNRSAQIAPWRDGLEAEGRFVMRGTAEAVPEWVQRAVVPENISEQIEEFGGLLETVPVGALERMSALDALVLRLLLVHFWRRAVLKLPAFAADLMPDDWALRSLAERLGAAYAELWAMSEMALELPAGGELRRFSRDLNVTPPEK